MDMELSEPIDYSVIFPEFRHKRIEIYFLKQYLGLEYSFNLHIIMLSIDQCAQGLFQLFARAILVPLGLKYTLKS